MEMISPPHTAMKNVPQEQHFITTITGGSSSTALLNLTTNNTNQTSDPDLNVGYINPSDIKNNYMSSKLQKNLEYLQNGVSRKPKIYYLRVVRYFI